MRRLCSECRRRSFVVLSPKLQVILIVDEPLRSTFSESIRLELFLRVVVGHLLGAQHPFLHQGSKGEPGGDAVEPRALHISSNPGLGGVVFRSWRSGKNDGETSDLMWPEPARFLYRRTRHQLFKRLSLLEARFKPSRDGGAKLAVYALVKSGQLRHRRVGLQIRVPLSAIEEFLSGST